MSPARRAEADADHDTLWQAKALVPSRLSRLRAGAPSGAALRHRAQRPRLFSGKRQEILEAVWAAAPQGGRERILLRACIQIANANLKLRMGKPHAAARLFGEALGELDALDVRKATRRRPRLCRWLSNRCARGAAEGQTGAAVAVQGRLGRRSAPPAGHEGKFSILTSLGPRPRPKHALLCMSG